MFGADRSPELQKFLSENALHGATYRVRFLQRKYAFYRCQQYAHLEQDWFGRTADQYETISPQVLVPKGWEQPAANVPVAGRRPTAPTHLCKTIVERFTGLVFSEERKPRVLVEGDPDTEDLLQAVIEQSKFWMRMREARMLGGATGAAAVSVHLRDGKFFVDVHPSWQVTPWWEDKATFQLRGLLKQYEFVEEEEQLDAKTGAPTGILIDRHYLYRRYLDDAIDVVFKPWPLDAGPPRWGDDQVEEAVEHGLGVCPAAWVQNLPCADHFDGDADCEGAWQTFDTIDRLLAQVNRSLLVNLDPTLFGTVDLAYLESQGGTIRKGSDNAIFLPQGSSVHYLEIGGAGISAALQLADRLKQQALDICRAVLVEPERISGAAQSAKAIEYIYAPMLEKADDLRAQYGDGLVKPLLELVILIANRVLGAAVEEAVVVDPAVIDLPPRIVDGRPRPRRVGRGGRVSLKWGPYFSPTAGDVSATVQAAVTARAGELIDGHHATQKVAPHFGIEDVAEVRRKIDEEKEAAMGMYGGGGESPPDVEGEGEDRLIVPMGESRTGAPSSIRLTGRMGEEPEERTPPGGEGGRP